MPKKILNSNPALDFFSVPDRQPQSVAPVKPMDREDSLGMEDRVMPLIEVSKISPNTPIVPMKPIYVETKSKRFQLLIQPSIYSKIAGLARAEGTSTNNYIHAILEDHIKKREG